MALQTCNRCRKRRIKCDLNLPACRNCSLADTECFFFDESLQQEFPRSYLHALSQKLKELQGEINGLKKSDGARPSTTSLQSAEFHTLDFHLALNDASTDDDSPAVLYLGPRNSAAIAKNLLRSIGTQHIISKTSTSQNAIARFLSVAAEQSSEASKLSFPLYTSQSDVDIFGNIPPSTQHSIIEHYLRVVQPIYPLLSDDEKRILLSYDNPLQWSSENFDQPNATIIIAVFAVASALIARDIDAKLQHIADTTRNMLEQMIHQTTLIDVLSIDATKQLIFMLSCQAICEFIEPLSGQVWDIVGRALAHLEQLRLDYNSDQASLDDTFRLLQLSLLSLESSLAIHFRRPSPYCEIWPVYELFESSEIQIASMILQTNLNVLRITQSFHLEEHLSPENLETFIPADLRLHWGATDVNPKSAYLSIALHPLITSKARDDSSENIGDDEIAELRRTIAYSAVAIIEDLNDQNKEHQLLSIWRASEQLFEAGLVWIAYILSSQRHENNDDGSTTIERSSSFEPLMKCTILLASFAEHWNGAKIYVQIWEALLGLALGSLT